MPIEKPLHAEFTEGVDCRDLLHGHRHKIKSYYAQYSLVHPRSMAYTGNAASNSLL